MSTDRELLELAAQAAGYEIHSNDERAPGVYVVIDRNVKHWTPLTDDGDALRLMVSLHLYLRPMSFLGPDGGYVVVGVADWPGIEERVMDNDQHAATRRAIVRAAAELGRAVASLAKTASHT